MTTRYSGNSRQVDSPFPEILSWDGANDLHACPLRDTYQLIRNVLAACVTRDGQVDMENAHTLIIYDARNPAFQEGGKGKLQWIAARSALMNPGNLRSCSWQRLIKHLSKDLDLNWMANALNTKYGFNV